jgi:hypothetical protein
MREAEEWNNVAAWSPFPSIYNAFSRRRHPKNKKKTPVPSRLNLTFSLLNLEHPRGSDWEVDNIAAELVNLVDHFGESDVAE